MPVIVFANPTGGAGKTTSALLLASELAGRGAPIAILDAEPEKWITQWGALPGKPNNVKIISDVTEDSIVDQIETAAAEAQFVVIDLEGTASLMVANAISMSDLGKRRPHPIDFTIARAGLGFDPAQRTRQGVPDEVILLG